MIMAWGMMKRDRDRVARVSEWLYL